MTEFERIAFLDEPPIAGAQWWQKSVQGELSRRSVVGLSLGAVALLGLGGALVVSSCGDDEETVETRASLDMQRRYGWSFGANGEPLTLTGLTAEPDVTVGNGQRARLLGALAMEPTSPSLKPFYQAALLEVPTAVAVEPPPPDTAPMLPFTNAYVPVADRDLAMPFRAGRAMARLFSKTPERCALVIDLTGAETIALAAGAAEYFEPVLMMPNWPHPRGIVRSHQALAALAIFRDYFDAVSSGRAAVAPPAFLLDADRTLPVPSAEQSFDNRYRATLPPAEALRGLGITQVFYVRAVEGSANDAKDVAARFSEYVRGGIPVRMLYASEFFVRYVPSTIPPGTTPPEPIPPAAGRYAALGEPASSFGGESDDLTAFRATYFGGPGTPFGKGARWVPAAPEPAELTRTVGFVPVVVAGGIILGAQMARRRDSWSRSFGGGGG